MTPSSKAVNVVVPTKVSDLTNDSGFISGITSSMVTSALGYTPYNSSNPSGYQANVIESVKVNGTALTITSKAVDVPVPTKVSDLTNDSGYITGISSTMVVNALGYTPVNPSALAAVATSGSYNDLSNKPTIPDAQIQSDWTQSDNTKKDYIKNKPTLATVATSGSYNDLSNKPTIPDAQIQSDWNQTDNTKKDYIKNKPTLATVATSGSYNDLSNKPTLGTAAAADATDFATATQGGKADTAVQPGDLATVATTGSYNDLTNKPSIPAAQIQADWTQSDNTKKDFIKNKPTLATVATSGSYNDLSNKPTIPTVNDATLTIKRNGTSVGTFTANASTDKAIDITVPTKVSDLTNDSGFITGITYSMVTTALGFTPYSAANPNGYQANVIETVKVNGTALTPSSKAVNVTVPTNVTDLADHTNYVLSSSLAAVATSGSYNDLSNKPSLATVATSGSYNDLSNKPTIPDAQIQSDWTQSDNTKKDYIKNKPTLATVATSGSYSDLSNKPTIPTVNNPTITFMQGSTLVGTMTLNQAGSQTFTFAAGSSGSFTPDGTTITTVNGEAKTIAVKNQNSASGALAQVKIWDGSASEYTSQRQAQTLDDNTLCVVKNVSNGADFGLITDSVDRGADWGLITDTPGPVSNMALHMGDYVLGTEEDIY